MHAVLKSALALSAALAAAHASAQVTFYQHEDFGGVSFTTDRPIDNFQRFGGFNDRASSVVVKGKPWEVCDDAEFRGRCMVLRPGNYRSLRDMGMNDRLSSARAVQRHVQYGPDRYAPRPMPGQITLFEHNDFQGRAIKADGSVTDFRRYGANDRASSAVVLGDRWEACENINYGGRCVVLRPGRYPNLGAMGLNDRLSSVREIQPTVRIDDGRYAPPPPQPVYDWRRRPDDRLHQANVTDVRAVYAAQQQQHCWVEREKVVQDRGPNVGGALIGGVIGGILGHQIGGGSGRDIATVGGAVAGAAIGANAGPDGRTTSIQNVQRCATTPAQGRPDYWDVTYTFRGAEHHVQATSPPGRTITVNDRGEPRL
ncbi:MAG TPA: beta/gamma crystallin-related protein [Ideonella sp.]|nr:beta/gamma crystallin-related protein [Ideonella sp.]